MTHVQVSVWVVMHLCIHMVDVTISSGELIQMVELSTGLM